MPDDSSVIVLPVSDGLNRSIVSICEGRTTTYEAKQFLDEIECTMVLEQFREFVGDFGGAVQTDSNGHIRVGNNLEGDALISSVVYAAMCNMTLTKAEEYVNEVAKKIANGMTIKEAKNICREEYKDIINVNIFALIKTHGFKECLINYWNIIKDHLESLDD